MPFYPKIYETWWGSNGGGSNPADLSPVTVANRFIFNVDCYLIGARYWRDLSDGASHIAIIRDHPDGNIIRVQPFHKVAASGSGFDGWHSTYFPKRVKVTNGDLFDLNVWFEAGNYSRALDQLAGGNLTNDSGNIYMQGDDALLHPNGRFSYGADLNPTSTFQSSLYSIDPIIWVPYN